MSIIMVNTSGSHSVTHWLCPINFNKYNWMTTESNILNNIDVGAMQHFKTMIIGGKVRNGNHRLITINGNNS